MDKAQFMHPNDPTMRNLYRSEGARLLLSSPQPGTLLHQRLLMINNLLERCGGNASRPESLQRTGSPISDQGR